MGEGKSWLDRIFGLCISFLIAAIAIHVGVGLIRSVWPTLLTILALVGVLAFIVAAVRARSDRW